MVTIVEQINFVMRGSTVLNMQTRLKDLRPDLCKRCKFLGQMFQLPLPVRLTSTLHVSMLRQVCNLGHRLGLLDAFKCTP